MRGGSTEMSHGGGGGGGGGTRVAQGAVPQCRIVVVVVVPGDKPEDNFNYESCDSEKKSQSPLALGKTLVHVTTNYSNIPVAL